MIPPLEGSRSELAGDNSCWGGQQSCCLEAPLTGIALGVCARPALEAQSLIHGARGVARAVNASPTGGLRQGLTALFPIPPIRRRRRGTGASPILVVLPDRTLDRADSSSRRLLTWGAPSGMTSSRRSGERVDPLRRPQIPPLHGALTRIILRDGWIEPRYSAWPLADGRPVSLAVALRSCGERVDAAIVETVILPPVVDSWEREGSHSQADVLALIQEFGDVNASMMRATYGTMARVGRAPTHREYQVHGRGVADSEANGDQPVNAGHQRAALLAVWHQAPPAGRRRTSA